MHLILKIFFLHLFSFVQAYDLSEGLLAQSDPCFETIHDEYCHTSLPEVYETSNKGANINTPDTQIYLFTVKNQDKAEPLHRCGGKLPPESDFDPNADTVVITHGWLDGMCRTAWMREMRNQLFLRGLYNVILVDWTWGNTFDLNDAALNSLQVGEQIAFVLKNIMIEKGMNGDKFHLIGHSFGCFAVSSTGRYIIKWRKSNKLRRITALDPAVGPYRKEREGRNTVSPNRAKFVDVIHSNGGARFPFFFGNNETLGHLDFYPNGGRVQPACYSYAIESLFKGDLAYGLSSFVDPPVCFHLQAIQFFKVSINPPAGLYVGVRCESYEDFQSGTCKRCCRDDPTDCAVAGMDSEYYYNTSESTRNNKYFFNTANECPFPEDYDFSINKDCPNGC